MTRRSPEAAAKLLLLNGVLYGKERDRNITRYSLSRQMLIETLGRRRTLPLEVLHGVQDELLEFGWMLVELPTDDFALLQVIQTKSWVKLSGKRLKDSGLLKMPDEQIDATFKELCPVAPEVAPEEE